MQLSLNAVGETALITLYIKAKDYTSPYHSVLNDKLSWEILNKIDYNFDKFNHAWSSYYGVLARALVFDAQIKKFLHRYPDCIVICLGAGLDTEFYRIDNGTIDWYNIDYPETIAARELLFDAHPRVHNIAKSILDPSWPTDIHVDGRKLLLIAEGVLMYLTEQEVKSFLNLLTDSFQEFTALFDLAYTGWVNKGKFHDAVSKMNVDFQWGVVDGKEVVQLNPKLTQIDFINITHSMTALLNGWGFLLYPFIYMSNNRIGIYKYQARLHKRALP
ncbi:class I SAM-dependent methyltransferase [Pelistega sp. MC2]|uniref:class I SAM-dependent methyltransferase n=1 Tax=Pelistega sp. MC2 TaxID=1720297 RepID=UPI0008D96D4E|nr:class I SAM-dependent methyltransferase [Pelistega sp. MC2]